MLRSRSGGRRRLRIMKMPLPHLRSLRLQNIFEFAPIGTAKPVGAFVRIKEIAMTDQDPRNEHSADDDIQVVNVRDARGAAPGRRIVWILALSAGAAAVLLLGMWALSNGGFAAQNANDGQQAVDAAAFSSTPGAIPAADAPTTSTGEPTAPPTGEAPNVNAPTTSVAPSGE